MFSIGEFAGYGGVSIRALRHYDEIGLLRPGPGLRAASVVPVVNQLDAQFDQLGIYERVKQAGPRILFFEREEGEDVTVLLALPATDPPGELPAPAHYRVLPEIEAAARCAAARRRASSRWSTTTWSAGSRSTATPAPGRDCGSTRCRHRRRGPAGLRDPAAVHPPRRLSGGAADAVLEQLAAERARACLELAEQQRQVRQHALRRRAGTHRRAAPDPGLAPRGRGPRPARVPVLTPRFPIPGRFGQAQASSATN